MNYGFHPEAEIELTKAIDYFEDQQRELGFEFSVEIYKTIQRIKENPRSWTKVSGSIRRVLVQRFPFGILDHFDPDSSYIFIIAVMHLRRKPGSWKERIDR